MVIRAGEPFDDQARRRIVESAASLLGMRLGPIGSEPPVRGAQPPVAHSTPAQAPAGALARPLSPVELIQEKQPTTNAQKIAVFERELFATIGVRSGVVWRGERQHYVRQNMNRPFDAFTVPVSILDPGPDGRAATADDGHAIPGYDLRAEFLGLAPVNIVRNVPDADSHYWTWDLMATRRFTGRWSLAAGFAHTWSRDQASGYFGQSVRNNV